MFTNYFPRQLTYEAAKFDSRTAAPDLAPPQPEAVRRDAGCSAHNLRIGHIVLKEAITWSDTRRSSHCTRLKFPDQLLVHGDAEAFYYLYIQGPVVLDTRTSAHAFSEQAELLIIKRSRAGQ